ncbi:tigger transposable element-derived protein 1-like [Anastrepha obliqua]|uniref:tigger transposable element-derived protein 1-like n=1 Tax=Anastrepha obliqua TaxID=95512 RepID=UPI002409C401|nr:tigger transposable element-derived protein 1-like [Anastrepha obliqua]
MVCYNFACSSYALKEVVVVDDVCGFGVYSRILTYNVGFLTSSKDVVLVEDLKVHEYLGVSIKNIDFKVLLILDNAPGHPKDLNHPNVEIVFLPPNTTSIIQPLDQDKSLKELKQSTLNGSWKNIWPEIVVKNNAVPPLHVEVSRILTIGQRFSGEGFDDMNEDDIYEIMNEDDVTSVEDICESIPSFTLKRIREGLSLVEKMKSFFTTNDPSLERCSKIIREIDINLAPYYDIEKELKKTTHQKLITDFVIIKPVEEPQSPTTSFLSNSENYVEKISSDAAIAPPKRPRANIFEDSETD